MAFELVNPRLESGQATLTEDPLNPVEVLAEWIFYRSDNFQPVAVQGKATLGPGGSMGEEQWDEMWVNVVNIANSMFPGVGTVATDTNPVTGNVPE